MAVGYLAYADIENEHRGLKEIQADDLFYQIAT